ncbi:MAG: hypothetical protein LUE13_06345, partial [Akkermansiaceae bacterium]|nr:hypothetical protein [Akkermansiaceae bacterium]
MNKLFTDGSFSSSDNITYSDGCGWEEEQRSLKRSGNFLFINIFITFPQKFNHYRKKGPQAFSVSPGTAHG